MVSKRKQAIEALSRLRKTYPVTGPFVEWSNPLELVIATVLSAQCTDKQVNKVTRSLFLKYKTASDYAQANLKTLEKEIYSTGFYRSKAKYLKRIGEILVEKHDGKVPDDLADLLKLPGVSNKTAYLVLAKGFGKQVGVSVDTHVKRIAPRLGLVKENIGADAISDELGKIFDPEDYLDVNEYFITHGRAVCVRVPKCDKCNLRDICEYGRLKKIR